MNPDRIKFAEIAQSKMPIVSTSTAEGIADEMIAAGATLSELADWKVPDGDTHNRPYCTRCGEEPLFDGWGFPAWSRRCPSCGAIMRNAKEK